MGPEIENPLITFKNRFAYLSEGEKRIVNNFINAFEDAINFQNIALDYIPSAKNLPETNDKSQAVDDRLAILKSYEAMKEFLESIIK